MHSLPVDLHTIRVPYNVYYCCCVHYTTNHIILLLDEKHINYRRGQGREWNRGDGEGGNKRRGRLGEW